MRPIGRSRWSCEFVRRLQDVGVALQLRELLGEHLLLASIKQRRICIKLRSVIFSWLGVHWRRVFLIAFAPTDRVGFRCLCWMAGAHVARHHGTLFTCRNSARCYLSGRPALAQCIPRGCVA